MGRRTDICGVSTAMCTGWAVSTGYVIDDSGQSLRHNCCYLTGVEESDISRDDRDFKGCILWSVCKGCMVSSLPCLPWWTEVEGGYEKGLEEIPVIIQFLKTCV